MGWILKLLGGAGGGWFLLAAGLAATAAGGAAGYAARGVIDAPKLAAEQVATAQARQQVSECKATHEAGRADADEKLIAALDKSGQAVAAATDRLNADAAKRQAATNTFLKDLANAPKSTVCGTSDPERAYRDSVRAGSARAATP